VAVFQGWPYFGSELLATWSHSFFLIVYRTYSKAQRVLEQYQHMPSFHGIQKDCTAIISQLKVLLRERLEDSSSSTSTVAETVDLLLELNEPAELLCQQYLEK
jgi:hypothetical protein